jgi:flap endonuclease-1
MMGRLDQAMIDDAKRLLSLIGIPHVQAPGEGEAQAAYMSTCGDVWGTSSQDYDSVLFGGVRVVRYLTIYGREYLPSKGISRRLKPELIELLNFLKYHGITYAQLVDLAILIGTDFNRGIKGVGPKTALRLVKRYGSLDNMPSETRQRLPDDLGTLRNIFLNPEVTRDYSVMQEQANEEELLHFLCDERGFSRAHVSVAVERLQQLSQRGTKSGLENWLRR